MNDNATESRGSIAPAWSPNAPKGGRAVIRRMLSESASTVPLFLGQTFIQSLRDVGYNNTVWAVCEHVDNAVQWGAQDVRVYFHQRGRRGDIKLDVLILDDGQGMAPDVLRVAMSFGGSMVYDQRDGIGRFGVGMKTAALSMGPRLEVYSWQEPGAFYAMELDVDEIGNNQRNVLDLPEPSFRERLPSEVAEILVGALEYPKPDDQDVLAESRDDLADKLGAHGTIVFVPNCDRLTYKQSKTLCDHATREMARIYRAKLAEGLKLYVNNRLVEPFDPTYSMSQARHNFVPELIEKGVTRSTLKQAWTVEIPVEEGSNVTAPVSVRLYALPIETWQSLPRKVLNNDLRVYDDHQVSFMRNGREVDIRAFTELSGKRHANSIWLRIQVDFDGRLDEALGVAMTKQGVRPKKYALDLIRDKIKEQVARVRENNQKVMAENALSKSKGKQSEAERRAEEADAFQRKPLPETPAESAELEQNVRALALRLRRGGETAEEAYARIKDARYVTDFKHDDYWPFYAVEYELGKVILTINTAHPFYMKLYKPLSELAAPETEDEAREGEAGATRAGELLVALQMVLLSLARTQSQMAYGSDREEHRALFHALQTEWSDNLKTQLRLD
ncbi:ATP-binding protein [Azospirillum sp. SYSU D00513]|uniref:ATP-binding protein n=1 Tax=Azospirillum sp. SYSU D00513 TaxID=2812561 RepID=UPI001A966FA0|nr:ATP-binding protein [Azospirillum sp. SYSU D00513]